MSENTEVAKTEEAGKAKKKPLFKKLSQFQTPDGKVFETQKEASEHLRGYLVDEALLKVANGDQQLADWMKANKEDIVKAFDAAKIERPPVTEETKAKMKAAREQAALKLAEKVKAAG
jgi:hypothetical protein